jgi:hypothetical protein
LANKKETKTMVDKESLLNLSNSADSAYQKGYKDYFRSRDHNPKSILNPAYNPPEGYEESYKAGWEAAKHDHTLGKGDIFPLGTFED